PRSRRFFCLEKWQTHCHHR
ncbi:hypothetical protein D046_3376B, partial [Vibrio parahaemolyticus V-223/04]